MEGQAAADARPNKTAHPVGRLLAFAGPRRALTYLGCVLSAISMLVSFGPYVSSPQLPTGTQRQTSQPTDGGRSDLR